MWNLELRVHMFDAFDENLHNIYQEDYVTEIYEGEKFLRFHKQFSNRSDFIDWLKPLYDSLCYESYNVSFIIKDLDTILKKYTDLERMTGIIENDGEVAYDLYHTTTSVDV